MLTKWVAGASVSLVMVALSLVLTLSLLDSGPFGAHTGKAVPAPGANDLSDGPSEGIKVHGDWVIEVRQPDGTLVQRREFENELMTNGREALMNILARKDIVDLWKITLSHIEGPQDYDTESWWDSPFGGGSAYICEEAGSCDNPGSTWSNSLVVDTQELGPADKSVLLTGTITADEDGSIKVVRTYLIGSLGNPGYLFTLAILDPVVSVGEGQQIQVKVYISFS